MGRRRRMLCATTVALAAGVVAAGPAQAALEPLAIQDVHRSDRIEDVTAFPEADGDVLLAWTGQNNVPTVLAAQKPLGGGVGPVQNLSTTPNAQDPRIVEAPNGTLLLAYSTATSTVPDEFVVRPPGGAFGAPQQFPIGERFVNVAIDGAGVVTAVWKGNRAGGLDFVATSSAAIGSPFVGFAALTPDTDDNFIIPRIALNAAGEGVAAWSRQISPTEDAIEASIRSGGAFGTPQELLRLPVNNGPRPAVAVDPSGEVLVVWSRSDGTDSVVEAVVRAPGAAVFGPVQTLARGASGPAVAMIAGNSALIAWSRVVGDTRVAEAVVRPPGGPVGPPTTLSQASAPNGSLTIAGVSFDASGGALVSWQRSTASSVLAEAARRPSRGPFEPAVQIADMTDTGRSLAVALQPSGDAVAAWRQTVSPTEVLLRAGGLRLLPDPATSAADLCTATPAPAPAGGGGGRFTLTTAQLAINQRIGQAAVRRLNAIAKWLDAGIETRDLCGGTVGPADLAPGITTSPRAAAIAALTRADPRPVQVAPPPPRGNVRFTLTPGQLLINQRIYQAAVRRANALQKRLASGLTGGDIDDGAVTQGKLHDRLRVVATAPAPAVPRSRTNVAPPGRRSPGAVALTVGQLEINQKVAQAGVRRANALLAAVENGISTAEIRNGTVGVADLAPDARP